MTRTLIVVASVLCLAVPAALAAPPADHGKPASPGNSASAPGQAADKNPAKKCKALREHDAAGFKTTYGDKPNAYGKCVSTMAKAQKSKNENEAKDEDENDDNGKSEDSAAKKCKAMKKDNPAGFATTYGDKPNAFGKCVSKLSKAKSSS
jgi:hypothetical protein